MTDQPPHTGQQTHDSEAVKNLLNKYGDGTNMPNTPPQIEDHTNKELNVVDSYAPASIEDMRNKSVEDIDAVWVAHRSELAKIQEQFTNRVVGKGGALDKYKQFIKSEGLTKMGVRETANKADPIFEEYNHQLCANSNFYKFAEETNTTKSKFIQMILGELSRERTKNQQAVHDFAQLIQLLDMLTLSVTNDTLKEAIPIVKDKGHVAKYTSVVMNVIRQLTKFEDAIGGKVVLYQAPPPQPPSTTNTQDNNGHKDVEPEQQQPQQKDPIEPETPPIIQNKIPEENHPQPQSIQPTSSTATEQVPKERSPDFVDHTATKTAIKEPEPTKDTESKVILLPEEKPPIKEEIKVETPSQVIPSPLPPKPTAEKLQKAKEMIAQIKAAHAQMNTPSLDDKKTDVENN